jgi:uncharacterized protein YecA (UPF0149 family)
MNDRHVSDFVAHDASTPWRSTGRDMPDILTAFLEASNVRLAELDSASAERALQSVVPRLKKARLSDAPDMLATFVRWAGATARVKNAEALAKEVERRGRELALEDQKQRQPVKNPGPEQGRNDPCSCGSGKKFKKCCGAGKA